MGVFLSLSGVIGADGAAVERSIDSYVANRGGVFYSEEATPEEPDVVIITENGGRTSVLHPQHFFEWDDLSRHLSTELQIPVFPFHIHDGDLWMFILFDNGENIARFNPIPDYWEDVDAGERARWSGDAEAIASRVPGLFPGAISRYLVGWDDTVLGTERPVKAYPDDESTFGICWQLVDFMRRIGLKYPMSGEEGIEGRTYRLRIEM